MAEPYISEIRAFGFGFAPKGWAPCNGQVMPIAQNQALFALLGITYGGNGTTTFCLPNLNGATAVHANGPAGTIQGVQGAMGGEATHALLAAEVPLHNHLIDVSKQTADQPLPAGNILAAPATAIYASDDPSQTGTLDPSSLDPVGTGAGHSNTQPSLALNFCIALQGLFPSRT
ncbi:MAG TPA: tail fiber protein [Fibrobacteria bacterium]|nr:tail fiber protein [Fibrobacteria bacterium]